MAKVLVVGLGYVGLTTAVGLAQLGHTVLGIDLSTERVQALRNGIIPIHEPGLAEEFTSQVIARRILVSGSYDDISSDIKFAFICVSTPSSTSGQADLSYIESSTASLRSRLEPGSILVMKSTVPIGTCRKVSAELSPFGISVASNPEFLSEGNALKDFFSPSRIVVGAEKREIAQSVLALYAGINAPQLICDLSSAEAIKHASNALLSVRLSFVNELAAVCEKMGADISKVTEGMGLDPRIGNNFLNPGPGWGGSCFPKDTVELAQSASEVGARMLTVEAASLSNSETKQRVAAVAKDLLGENSNLKKVAIWGLAFKANTDDIRESPAVQIASTLSETGARIVAFDPVVKSVPRKDFFVATSPIDACDGADLLVVLTEWDLFKSVDPSEVREVMSANAAVYDARGILDRPSWEAIFPRYVEIGRPTLDSFEH